MALLQIIKSLKTPRGVKVFNTIEKLVNGIEELLELDQEILKMAKDNQHLKGKELSAHKKELEPILETRDTLLILVSDSITYLREEKHVRLNKIIAEIEQKHRQLISDAYSKSKNPHAKNFIKELEIARTERAKELSMEASSTLNDDDVGE